MQKCCLSAVAVLLFGATPTISIANNTQETVVVTATRTAQTADESLASVTVINRKDIERQQARSVQDLLRGVPGVSIANNGGPGKNTSVFMRGTNSDHVLVLIDGIRVGSATTGGAAFQNIPVDQIERIEIVRGPRSSLYGSEAIGGVIQIFTRKGSGKGLRQNFSFGGGSYGTYSGSGGLSGNYKDGWFNLNASGIGTNGFNACTGSVSPFAGCGADEPDRDGYRNVAGSARAGYRFQNGLDIEANYLRSDGKTEFDGFQNKSEIVQQVFGGAAHFSPVEMWRISLTGGVSDQNSLSFKNNKDTNRSRFDTRRVSVSLLNNISFGKNNLSTVGFDFQNDHVKTSSDFARTSRYNFAVFGQHQMKIAAHDLLGAVRVDINEQFGSRITGGPSWGYSVTDNLRLTASFGTAFKAPTFNELYFPSFAPDLPAFGNPDLRPEKSYSAEFGVNGTQHWGNWSLNVYETHIDNLIIGIPNPPGSFNTTAFNIDKARIRGLEAIFSTQIKGWQLNGNLTFLDPENRADRNSGNRGNVLPRRAKQSYRLDANRTFLDKYVVGAMMLAEGTRFDRVDNVRKLDSYFKFDLRAEYIINQNWRLQGRVENLFNVRYETASFFNQPGRNFFVTIRYQPSS